MTDVFVNDGTMRGDELEVVADGLMAMTTDGIIVRRPSGTVVRCSERALAMLGLRADDVIGRTPDAPMCEYHDQRGSKVPLQLHPYTLAVASGRDVDDWTYQVVLRSGEHRLMTGDTRVVHDADRRLVASICRFRDITDEVSSQVAVSDEAARFRTAFDRSPVALLVVDARGQFRDANPALSQLFGVPEEEVRSMDWIALAERQLSEQLSARLVPPFLEETEPEVLDYRRSDGSLRHGLTQVCSIPWPDTERAALVQITDVTDRMTAEDSVRLLASQIDRVFATSPIGMGLIGPDGCWTRVNRSLARLHGVIEADMVGGSPLDQLHRDDHDLVNRFAARALEGRPAAVDHRIVTPGGEVRWHRTQLTKVSAKGSPALLVQTVDQTAERRSEAESRAYDRVTGLLSQKGIAAEVEHTTLGSRQSGAGFAVICVDIDGFRQINDRLGIRAADRLLEKVGVTMRAAMPLDGAVGRLHGDVFAGVAPVTSRQETKRTVESVQRALQAVTLRGETDPISCRLGAIFVEGRDADPYDLLTAAEQAAQAAAQVPERFVIQTRTATGSTTGSASERWYQEIEEALARDLFLVVGEPINPVAGPTDLHRYEFLVRLLLPGGVRVSMPRFERFAQRLGCASHIDHWVIGKGCGFLAVDEAAEIEVNLSLASIRDPETIRVIRTEVEERGVDPSRLLLAVDEGIVADALADVLEFAHEAHDIGVGFCVDNFWLCHQGLRLVETIGAQRVKLPSSAMRQAGGDVADSVLLRSTIRSARDMGVEVAVPFVTDGDALDRARELGVDYVQGHFVGAAIEVD